jgi:type II secretion system protein N
LTLKKRRIDLTHAELKGPNIYGTLTGTISIRRAFMDSGLNLKGTVDPSQSFLESSEGSSVTVKLLGQSLGDGPLSFRVRGTFKNPRFDLI